MAPAAAKFGKQIRYAERRGIPYVWFPGAGEPATRSRTSAAGEQVDADPATWEPPAADLRPVVVVPATVEATGPEPEPAQTAGA